MRFNLSIFKTLTMIMWYIGTAIPLSIFANPTVLMPAVDLGPDTVVCGTFVLGAGIEADTYLWSTGATSSEINITTTGLYWLEVSTSEGTARDSVQVTVLDEVLAPQPQDTFACGAGDMLISAEGTAPWHLWYADAALTELIGVGDSLSISVSETQDYFVEGARILEDIQTGWLGAVGNRVGAAQKGRGLIFDVFEPFELKTVSVYPTGNGATTLGMQILDENDSILMDMLEIIPANSAGLRQIITIDYTFLPGLRYKIVSRLVAGNTLATIFPFDGNYPIEVPGVLKITEAFNGSSRFYDFFFDWEIDMLAPGCRSEAAPFNIQVEAAPQLDFAPDTLSCATPVVLDASNAEAVYDWTTGETSSSIVVSESDTIGVTVSIGRCSISDSIRIQILDEPTIETIPDTFACGAGDILITAEGAAPWYLWYTDEALTELIGVGDSLEIGVSETQDYYVEGVAIQEDIRTGWPGLEGFEESVVGAAQKGRGLIFDVFEPFNLKSVKVYPTDQTGTTLGIQILDANDSILLDVLEVIPAGNQGIAQEIFLNYTFVPGLRYKLVSRLVAGSRLATIFPFDGNYPIELPGILSITEAFNGSNRFYDFFFDWVIDIPTSSCRTAATRFNIQVENNPELSLRTDTISCATPVVLDASNNGAMYDWSTGETSSSIVVSESDTVGVTVTIGRCIVTDSIRVQILPDPTISIISDTLVCASGEVELQAESLADLLAWYDSPVGGKLINIGPSFATFTLDSSTYFVEGANFAEGFRVGEKALPENNVFFVSVGNRGIRFDVEEFSLLKSVAVYASGPLTLAWQIRDSADNRVFEGIAEVPVANEAYRVPIDVLLTPGNEYKLVARSVSGAGLAQVSQYTGFPMELEGVMTLKGNLQGGTSVYDYFFDWDIAAARCFSERSRVSVNIPLPLNLGDSLYVCNDTIIEGSLPFVQHLWSTGSQESSIRVAESGTYTLEVSDGVGCIARDTIVVEIPEDAGLQDDGTLCGQTLSTLYDETAVFNWSTGETTPTIDITTPGTYIVQVEEPRGCVLLDTVDITGFSPFPEVELGPNLVRCDSAVLDAQNLGVSYLWSTGETTRTITVTASGSYTVTVTNEASCASSDSITLSVFSRPRADFFLPDTITNAELRVDFVNLSSFGSFQWDFGDGTTSVGINPNHIYADTGFYCVQLVVTDIINSCGKDTLAQCFYLQRFSVGIESLKNAGFQIYPNPVQEILRIAADVGTPAFSYSLYDTGGRMIRQGAGNPATNLDIDMSALQGGIYLVILEVGGRRYTQKVVKY